MQQNQQQIENMSDEENREACWRGWVYHDKWIMNAAIANRNKNLKREEKKHGNTCK